MDFKKIPNIIHGVETHDGHQFVRDDAPERTPRLVVGVPSDGRHTGGLPVETFDALKAAIDREDQPSSEEELMADQYRHEMERAYIAIEKDKVIREMAALICRVWQSVHADQSDIKSVLMTFDSNNGIDTAARANVIALGSGDLDSIMLGLSRARQSLPPIPSRAECLAYRPAG